MACKLSKPSREFQVGATNDLSLTTRFDLSMSTIEDYNATHNQELVEHWQEQQRRGDHSRNGDTRKPGMLPAICGPPLAEDFGPEHRP